jgi:transcriptional regulator with GAF, ATPase, and Fis domain
MVLHDDTHVADLEMELQEHRQFHRIVGRSQPMQKVYNLIKALANVQTTVLITGESGTGKELVAEALHLSGDRSHKPLVKVNCSALPESLLESELFGHVKGAFTGAIRDNIGRFHRADGGTIFFDEIGDVSPKVQLKLLRVLEEREFERVGSSAPTKVDVRLIAATNRNLMEKVSNGELREDLYYRLKVIEIMLPPLRDRREDIPLLVEHFRNGFSQISLAG